eukprot:5960988-Prymnesium_polylepis.1
MQRNNAHASTVHQGGGGERRESCAQLHAAARVTNGRVVCHARTCARDTLGCRPSRLHARRRAAPPE